MKSRYRPKISLEGVWRFKLDPDDKGEVEGWYNGLDTTEVIYVPSSWNEQNPLWDNYMGVAWYETEFFVPEIFREKIPWIIFEGAGYKAKVWLNGVYLGEHECSFTSFKFNIRNTIKFNEVNKLVVRIDNKLTPKNIPPGEAMNKTYFDFFHYGGIFRPVYIEFTEESYIEDITVITDHKGTLKVNVVINGVGKFNVNLHLLDSKGNVMFSTTRKSIEKEVLIEEEIEGVKPWSPQEPNLYTLKVDLLGKNGILDSVEEQIGFRSIKIENGKLLLNDKPVFLKGIGRHEDYPITGKFLPGAVLVRDFYLMKELKANAFRTTHYPYSRLHLDLADRFGFMVILEAPLVGLRDIHFIDEEYLNKAKKIIKEMIKEHKNRPSVIAYSIANEPFSYIEEARSFLKALYDHVKSLDPTRPITFASALNLADKAIDVVDIISVNLYLGWYSYPGDLDTGLEIAEKILDKLHELYPTKPIMVTEFGAGAISGLHSDPPLMWSEEYQAEFIKRYIERLHGKKYLVGMHIWGFADFRTPQSSRRTILNRKGLFTRTRQPKLAARIVKEEFSKIPTFLEN